MIGDAKRLGSSRWRPRRRSLFALAAASLVLGAIAVLAAPAAGPAQAHSSGFSTRQSAVEGQSAARPKLETTEDWNRRLEELVASSRATPALSAEDYRIGPEDLLAISVFEAPEMNREVRVSASGEISLPLLEGVKAAGLTPRELEFVLQELLHRTYMKDPHVSVFVREMQSHPVSVVGAVKQPGVFQIRGSKTLLEVLSLAGGLAADAGDSAVVLRGAGYGGESKSVAQRATAESSAARPNAETKSATATALGGAPTEHAVQVDLSALLESADPRYNPEVYPGDIVKVARAGVVYVIGEVRKPGGYALKTNEKLSVLQAIALSEGLTGTAAKAHARLIRMAEGSGERTETPIDLAKILAGKAPDPLLRPQDILFVPNSTARSTWTRGLEVTVQTISGVLIFHR